jgi:hypothetical protein
MVGSGRAVAPPKTFFQKPMDGVNYAVLFDQIGDRLPFPAFKPAGQHTPPSSLAFLKSPEPNAAMASPEHHQASFHLFC